MMDHLELEGDHRRGDLLKILGYSLGLLICHFATGLCAERSESGALRFIVFVVTTTMMMRAGWLLGRDTARCRRNIARLQREERRLNMQMMQIRDEERQE